LNPGLVFWTIVTFIVVLAILSRVAWKPLVQALVSREERIRTALDEAESAQKESRRLLEENRKQLARAEEESQRIIREGREMGDRLKNEIVEKANASSRAVVEQAKDEIRREKEAALTQLRSEVADLAIAVATKIIDQNLDTPKQRQLADAAIKELQNN
jgi:F-type H+-transporting ATPase subunit b